MGKALSNTTDIFIHSKIEIMKIKLILATVYLLISFGCKQTNNFLVPPIKDINIPLEEYIVDANLGDTVFYKSGSILLFPPNAFVDKDGNIIQGNVQIKYREFERPIDFFLSGIPMDYESDGQSYTFESSGMAEILAFKDGVPVFVNPSNKPEINLVSRNNSDSHNIYFLDTLKGIWIDKEKSIVTDLKSDDTDFTISEIKNNQEIIAPIKPEKANNLSPVIRIVIDPASFKELLVYDNMKFQIDPKEKNFNPFDTLEEWKRVELQKGRTEGLYVIKFSNNNRSISFSARPVLEGKDYDKALKVFEKRRNEYEKLYAERLDIEKEEMERFSEDSLANIEFMEENARIERMNALIAIRNRETAIFNKQNEVIYNAKVLNELIRSFNIDGFGVWNCDQAIQLKLVPITPEFKDDKGNDLELTNIAVIYKSLNGIIRFPTKKIKIRKDSDYMIIGVYNGRYAYISYDECRKLNASENTDQTFVMTVVSEENNNYEYIKKVIEN